MRFFGKKSSNYPYAVTRVRAKRRFLIKNDEYLRLSLMDLAGIGRYIGESQYKEEVESLSSMYSDAALIERATNKNLAKTYNQIVGFCTGELKEMVTHYLAIVDAWNVKTILRGKFHGATEKEILNEIIFSGLINRDKLEKLARLDGIEAVINNLSGTQFHQALDNRLKEIGGAHAITTLINFENDIDKAYYSNLLATVSSIRSSSTRQFLNFIRKDIDIENLTTLMKIKFELINHEKTIDNIGNYMIPGGHELKEFQLKKLIATVTFSQFVNELRHYSFYNDIKEAIEVAEEKNDLEESTRAAEKHLMIQADQFAKLFPLSVLPVINYLILKKREVDNLRIIASGRSNNLSTDTIRGLLVI